LDRSPGRGLAGHAYRAGTWVLPSQRSFAAAGMIVAPCSIKSLSAIANSYADDLLTRAADVQLKEVAAVVDGARDPLHLGHLELLAAPLASADHLSTRARLYGSSVPCRYRGCNSRAGLARIGSRTICSHAGRTHAQEEDECACMLPDVQLSLRPESSNLAGPSRPGALAGGRLADAAALALREADRRVAYGAEQDRDD